MRLEIEADQILRHTRRTIGENLTLVHENKRSGRNIVLTVNDSKDDLIIKAGLDAEVDYLVLNMLNGIGFPSPKLRSYSGLRANGVDFGITVMSKLSGIQARELPLEERFRVVSVLIDELQKLKNCKSSGGAGGVGVVSAGYGMTWKTYLGQVISEAEKDLKSPSLINTVLIDRNSILPAVEIVRLGIATLPDDLGLNLLHNDLNLANCIVTATDGHFVGVVDWSDAIFGEPLFDLARLRMNLEQSSDERSLEVYKLKVRMSSEENNREKLYYLCRLIEYLGIYKRYGVDHWFNRNQELLLEAIGEYQSGPK